MKIVCDNCSTKYSIADEKVRGKVFKIKCKKCSHIIVVKGQDVPAPVAAAGFDQKDTRVFDYSGFDGQQGAAAAANAPAGDAIWHLVIDREQIGPLTLAEVQAKWSAGEIDADSYAWREGFADWQRLGAIEELAFIHRMPQAAAAAPLPPAPGAGPDLGDARAAATGLHDSGPTGKADPTDLFGAASAAAGGDEEPAGDLFGAAKSAAASTDGGVFSSAPAAARHSGAQDDLFSSAGAGAGGGLAAEPGRPMTAQRNENSVLFSLNNLAALATDVPAARAPVGSGVTAAAPTMGSASGNTEGSGLIDIRAMAAMTLGAAKKDDGPRLGAADDDLPVFSATSFSGPAAGVLLPTVAPERNNKLVYAVMGVIGLLALAAIVLVAVILMQNRTPTVDARLPGVPTGATPGAPQPPPGPSTPTGSPPAPGTPTAAVAASGAATPGATPGGTPTASPPTAPPQGTPGSQSTRPPEEKKPTPPRRPTDSRATPTGDQKPREKPQPTTTTPQTTTPPVTTPPATAQKCDEVACLVTPDLPCCPKKKASTAAPVDSSLPERLEQPDIMAGMSAVNGRVGACNDRFKVAGQFKVRITVGADGNVSASQVQGAIAGTPEAGCVEAAVKGAHFKRTQKGITFSYPYSFH
jgi:predicted Zn finger-like uncharacterized protein